MIDYILWFICVWYVVIHNCSDEECSSNSNGNTLYSDAIDTRFDATLAFVRFINFQQHCMA